MLRLSIDQNDGDTMNSGGFLSRRLTLIGDIGAVREGTNARGRF